MSESPSRSILWVEDEPETVAGPLMALEMEGHEIVTARSAVEALGTLRVQHFDLLLLDEKLATDEGSPNSGSEVVKQLQGGDLGVTNAGIPFAFVTAFSGLVDSDSVVEMPGYLGLINKAGDLMRELGKALEGLVTVPGLVDAGGKPLDSDSPQYREIAVKLRATTADMRAALAEQPNLLHDLHFREFEEVIAELFRENGFAVDLTPSTWDRGADLYAVRQTGLGPQRYVIECKRHAPHHRVGPALVRQLRGVVDRERATCGVLVTTSTFTSRANEEQQTSPHRLSLRDFEHVVGWLRGRPIID